MEAQVLLNYKELAFFIKNTKNNHSSASELWKTPNLDSKRIQGHFLKIHHSRKY